MLKKILFWATVGVVLGSAIMSAQAQQIQGSRGVPYNEGVFTADSLVSITGAMGKAGTAWYQPGQKAVFKLVSSGNDTSAPIPAANAVLDGFLWTSRATGTGAIASGSTTVGLWLQGAYSPTPYKGVQWFDIAILDSISQVPDTTNVLVRPVKSLVGRGSFIRGVQGDTIGRGVPYWRIRLNGAQAASTDSSYHYVQLFLRYPRTQLR